MKRRETAGSARSTPCLSPRLRSTGPHTSSRREGTGVGRAASCRKQDSGCLQPFLSCEARASLSSFAGGAAPPPSLACRTRHGAGSGRPPGKPSPPTFLALFGPAGHLAAPSGLLASVRVAPHLCYHVPCLVGHLSATLTPSPTPRSSVLCIAAGKGHTLLCVRCAAAAEKHCGVSRKVLFSFFPPCFPRHVPRALPSFLIPCYKSRRRVRGGG